MMTLDLKGLFQLPIFRSGMGMVYEQQEKFDLACTHLFVL